MYVTVTVQLSSSTALHLCCDVGGWKSKLKEISKQQIMKTSLLSNYDDGLLGNSEQKKWRLNSINSN